jgi:hypothetical protein
LINDIRTNEVPKPEEAKTKKAGGKDSKLEGKSAETKTQGPMREKGLKSNNKELG